MSEIRSASEPNAALQKRAAEFYQRKRFWDWSAADQAELDAWLAESVLHRVAYLRVEAGDERMGTLVANSPPRFDVQRRRVSHRRFVFPLLAAASIAAIAALGIPYARTLLQPADRIFGTEVGGHALLKFSDGTEIELNTNSAVHYRMTTQQRTVWLDRGEAYFRVAHNAANPFTVIAGNHRITDIGTEFLVRDDEAKLEVALVRGRAQLAGTAAGSPVAMLTPGDDAIATSLAITVTKKSPQEIADELAWQRGVLVFRNTRLDDAVRRFNRYNETKLVLADPSIADMKLSAELKINNVEGFVDLAQTVLNLRVDRAGNEFLISRGARDKSNKAVGVKHGN